MKAMVLLAGLDGFRVHEIAKFHGSQIDHEAHTVEVEGKGGVIAVLPAPQLLGHAKITTTQIYTLVDDGSLRTAASAARIGLDAA